MQNPHQLNEAVELLLSRVPNFANARSRDSSFMSHASHDSPYLVFGDFGLFLLEQLNDQQISRANEDWLRPSFQLIDEMLTSRNPEVANLIQVGVLEVLAEHADVILLVKSHLSASGQEKLDEWIRIA